jgi:hypothetical protein
VWGPRGEALGYRRAAASYLAHQRLGSINCISWHPYQLLFACGGVDALVAVCEVDLGSRPGGADATPPVSPR